MKIVTVQTTLFRDPDFAADASSRTEATHCLVELTTDAGPVGVAVASASSVHAVNALVRDLLLGTDPRGVMRLCDRMREQTAGPNDAGTARARAALDIAMWDLKAKANDEPLWKTLGGSCHGANVHLGWDGTTGDDAMTEWFGRMSADAGIRSGSMPAGDAPTIDRRRMADVQHALRANVPESGLMLHFETSRWPQEAIRHVRELESNFDLTWVRSPVRSGDFRGARQVADRVAAAVCMGQGLADPADFLPHLELYAANVIELDVALLGISGVIRMADAAFGFELPVMLSDYAGHLAVQLFTALPTPASCEINHRIHAAAYCSSGVTFENGRAVPGDQPGNGLSIDRDAVAAMAIAAGGPN